MRLPNQLFPAALGVAVLLCMTPGVSLAQRGGGGHGGGGGGFHGGGGGGFRGGGMGGGFRGGGFGGGFGGFRGGGFRGGFRGNAFRGGFVNRGFGNRFGGFGPWGWGWGWGGGFWPSWSGWDSGYAYPVDYGYGYPAYSDMGGYSGGYPAAYPSAQPSQPAQNITVIYPPQSAGAVIREYDEYGQQIQPAGPGPTPGPPASTPSSSAPGTPPVYLIAFKDHEIRAVSAYWITGATLHFITLEHQELTANLDAVDRDLSTRLNRERHLTFSLGR